MPVLVNIQPHILTGPGFRSHDLVMDPRDQVAEDQVWKPVEHIKYVLVEAKLPWDGDLILRAQREDPLCQALIRKVKRRDSQEGDNELLSDLKIDPFLILDNKLLYLRDKRRRSQDCINID